MNGQGFEVSIDVTASVATVRLARSDEGNRLLTHEIRDLGRAIREAGESSDIKAVVLCSGGEAFCLGRKPEEGAKAPSTAMEVREQVTQPILDLYADIRATPVPVIAVIQGEAKGFGCALVGQCDLAIAAEGALFSMPEMDSHLPPTLAISAVLGKLTPKRILHMVYTRRTINASDALSTGLVSEVVAASSLDSAVQDLLSQLTDRNRASLCAIKEYMGTAPYVDPHSAARLASNILSVVLSSPKDL